MPSPQMRMKMMHALSGKAPKAQSSSDDMPWATQRPAATMEAEEEMAPQDEADAAEMSPDIRSKFAGALMARGGKNFVPPEEDQNIEQEPEAEVAPRRMNGAEATDDLYRKNPDLRNRVQSALGGAPVAGTDDGEFPDDYVDENTEPTWPQVAGPGPQDYHPGREITEDDLKLMWQASPTDGVGAMVAKLAKEQGIRPPWHKDFAGQK